MPAYQVTGPDGRSYRVNTPEGATSQDAIAYVYNTYYGGQRAAPAEPTPEEQSVFRQVADVPVQIGTGIAQGIRFITDAFGADNVVSQNIRGVEGYLQGLLSAQAKQDQAEISRIMTEAQDKGVGEQVLAGLQAFATAPLDTLSQAAGTALPTIVGGLAGGALRGAAGAIASRAAMPAIGAVTGAGVAKSTIYDETKQAMLEAGADEATAEMTASRAQEYGGKNLDQILIASGIGAFAAGTGLEKAVAGRILRNTAAQKAAEQGALRRVLGGAAIEAAPEAIQAGQEQLAANIALQREGFDVPTLRGVAGAATMEGLAGAVLGGGVGAIRPRTEVEVAPELTPEEPEPEITPEALAPKTGRPARPAPIRARTLEELRGELPAAPVVEAEEVAAPREPMQFERTKEPTPEAVQEATDFTAQFPAGGKEFNLFKARAIARKLGYEGITKNTTRADIEPLLRTAVAPPIEVPAPAPIEAPPIPAPTITPPVEISKIDKFEVVDTGVDPRIQGLRAEERAIKNRLRAAYDERDVASDAGDSTALTNAFNKIDLLNKELSAVEQRGLEVAQQIRIERATTTLPEFDIPEVAKLAYQIADIVSPPKPVTVEAPRMEVPSELPRTGIEQAVVGTTPRGIEVPVSRPVAAEPRVEGVELPRLAAVEPAPARPVERAEGVPSALEVSNADLMTKSLADFLRGKDAKTRKLPTGETLVMLPKAEISGQSYVPEVIIPAGERVTIDAATTRALTQLRNNYAEEGREFPTNPADMSRDEFAIAYNAGAVPQFEIEGDEFGTIVKGSGPSGLLEVDVDLLYDKIQRQKETAIPAPAAPTQIFESIDILNRPLPPVTEQLARDRAPSLRRELGKAVKQFDEDKMSGAELANRASMLLLQTQKERIVQPRVRGAEFIRERLFNASRRGEIDPDGVELASWFIQQNPLLVEDLGVSVRQQPENMKGSAAFYNPANRIITLFKGKGNEQTATHEILHHTERLMPAEIRAGILKAYVKQLTKAIKKTKSADEKRNLQALLEHHLSGSDSIVYDSVIRAFKSGTLSPDKYQFVNPSEFWAVNGSRIVQGRYDIPPGVVGQIRKWLREFIEKAKDLFGLTSDAAIIRALDSLAKADGKYQTDQPLAQAPAYMEIEPPKKPKAMKPKKSVAELRREASEKMMKPGVVRETVNKLVGPEVTYEKLAKNFQNQRRKLKKIQDDLRLTGRLETVGEDKNDAENSISTAANRASYIVQTEVEPVSKRLREAINAYAKSVKATTKDALEKIDGYLIALHEPERRETKYLRNVPLNNTTKLEFLPGEPEMTAADARAKLEERRSLAKNAKQAEAIQDMMRFLAANYADPRGYSPVKARLEEAGKPTPEEMTTDFYDDIYSVIGPEYSQEDLEALREEYEGLDAEQKQLVDQVRVDLNALHELNKNLNRRANYWTDKVDRVVESYGWKNYVPFKGSPRADKTLDTDTEYLSGELSQVAESFEGRRTNFDSPVLQTIAESYFAASRAGRGTDVTQTIKNLIKLGVIKTKTRKPKIFTFEDRNSPDFDYNEVRGADKVLHYNEDGSVEVYRVEDPEVLEAIKTTYRDMNTLTKIGNAVTSTLGQLHTRFNPAFPPMDFVRNSITNAGLISAREGGKLSREYLSAVATNVTRLGFFKAGKLSNLLAKNDTAELNRLYNTGHPFYRDAIDMMKYGGRTMYRMSFNISDTMTELQKELGPKKIMKNPSQFLKWVDVYNDAFEITSRVAAYTVRKQQNIAEAKKKRQNVNDRKVMEDIEKEAAAFALSLMDFRKIGKYGRELGAYFMFIRPAATGAVDAIDALRPGFQRREKAFARLEPEVQELFETKTLAEEVNKLEEAKRPNKKNIEELKKEIARREKSFDEFESRRLDRAKNARNTAFFTLAAGAAIYAMAAAVSGEDDEGRNRVRTDDTSRWTRYARLPLIGSEGFLQVPWGFGVSALMSAGAQFAALAGGSSSFKDFAGNMVEIGIDSYLPIPASRINPADNFGAWLIDSVTPSAARPLVEFVLNVDAMGNPIYNSRAGKYADAFTGSARTSEMHRKIAEKIFEMSDGAVSFSPDSVAFFMNNYADALNHLGENSWNLYLTATGDKEFDAKKDLFVLRSFVGRNSNYDARKFAEAEKEIKSLSQRLKTFEDFGTPDQLARFYDKNPNADILIQIYNQGVNGELRRLRRERNEILRDRTLTPKERDMYIDDIRLNENYIKKGLVEDFEAYKGN